MNIFLSIVTFTLMAVNPPPSIENSTTYPKTVLIIDRLDGQNATIEINGETLQIPTDALPHNAKEGDALKIAIDRQLTAQRALKAENRLRRINKNAPTVDIIINL